MATRQEARDLARTALDTPDEGRHRTAAGVNAVVALDDVLRRGKEGTEEYEELLGLKLRIGREIFNLEVG